MSATIADVLKELKWYVDNGGYYEKQDGTAKYLTDTVENFPLNKGSANYTVFGKICGLNPGAWCAMYISTGVLKATGSKEAAKKAMWGVWPYTSCNQLWDAAPYDKKFWSHHQRWNNGKGDRKEYVPEKGDIAIFTDNGVTRTHTGGVYDVDDKYVYTYEGNSGNKARKRAYPLTSSYIYGYVKLNLPKGEEASDTKEKYGKEITVKMHELSPGCAGVEVGRWQMFLNGMGITDDGGNALEVDYDYGKVTKQATKRLQKLLFPDDEKEWDGEAGEKTLNAAWKNEFK